MIFLLLNNCSLFALSNSVDKLSFVSFICFILFIKSLFSSVNFWLFIFKASICVVRPRRSELKLDCCVSRASLYFEIESFIIDNSFFNESFSFSNFFLSKDIVSKSLFIFFNSLFNFVKFWSFIFFSFVIIVLLLLLIEFS